MIKICIIGAAGKMGQAILKATHDMNLSVDCLVVKSQSQTTLFHGYEGKIYNEIQDTSDVILDFSNYQSSIHNVTKAAEYGIPIIIGTTGEHTKQDYAEYASQTPILWSPNNSISWNIINQAIKKLCKFNDFTNVLGEIHHKNKKDNPSGTTNELNENINASQIWSLRVGSKMSMHQFLGANEEEIARLEHQVLNRHVYAKDALKAALWLKTKPPGLYDMSDFINNLD